MTNLDLMGFRPRRVWSTLIYKRFGKRAFDLVMIWPVLFCLLIALCVIVPLNPVFNPGPLFFVQRRVGREGWVFQLYKFRSMTRDGHVSVAAGFMRRTRVDELPQILNVLKGDMSLIGPRPERPGLSRDFARQIPGYESRQVIRPGITGLAQLMVGYTDDLAGARRKLTWDKAYLERQSFGLDLRITWMTMRVVFAHLLHIPIKSKL